MDRSCHHTVGSFSKLKKWVCAQPKVKFGFHKFMIMLLFIWKALAGKSSELVQCQKAQYVWSLRWRGDISRLLAAPSRPALSITLSKLFLTIQHGPTNLTHFQRPRASPAATPGSIQSHFLDMTLGGAPSLLTCSRALYRNHERSKQSIAGCCCTRNQRRKEPTAVQSAPTRAPARWGSRFGCLPMINLRLRNERAAKARHVLDIS